MSSKISPTIIVHGLGFLVVLLGSVLLISYNLFHTSQNTRFSLKDLLNPKTIRAMLLYRNDTGVSCVMSNKIELPSWLDNSNYQIISGIKDSTNLILAQSTPPTWSIYIADNPNQTLSPIASNITYPGTQLSLSYAQIQSAIMYPDCSGGSCRVWIYNLDTGDKSSFPASAAANRLPLPNLYNFFFDETRQLVSYTTSPKAGTIRVVINPQQELIQRIQESPHPSRQLQFKGYLPGPGLLRYHDPTNDYDYFYAIDKIGLYRKKC